VSDHADDPVSAEVLLGLARQGDRAALERLLTTHAADVSRWARGVCGSGPDADDVAQDVLIAAVRHLSEVRDAAAIPAWLRTVTRRTCARRRRRRAGAPEVWDDASDAVSTAPGPEQSASAGELARALSRLEPRARQVLVLRDVEGLTAPEVAELLGLELGAVKTRLHRARASLRDAVAPAPRAPDCPDLGTTFSRYLEGELDAAACDALEAHVSSCPTCGPACAALRSAVGECRTLSTPPPDVAERVRRALRLATGA
jgi:RNA polymerase sigma-70 factor (ECF subfamily)